MQLMLNEEECAIIEKALNEKVEPRKVAAYLCFHMGIPIMEVCALRWKDIDLNNGILRIRNSIGRPEDAPADILADFVDAEMPRNIIIPWHILRYLGRNAGLYSDGDCFIVTGQKAIPSTYHMQNLLNTIKSKYGFRERISTTMLRNTFIRRALQSGVDLHTVCMCLGVRQPNTVTAKFGQFLEPHYESLALMDKYCMDYDELQKENRKTHAKRMNLMILGAGSQGPVVKEIADAIGIFNEIAFLDDDKDNLLAMDTCVSFEKYLDRYPVAIPSFGDCKLRAVWAERLEDAGFILPTLISPMATISPTAKIAEGVVVEAKAIISAGAEVGRCCIISAAAVLDKECSVGANSHIGCSCTITKGSRVDDMSVVSAGKVFSE